MPYGNYTVSHHPFGYEVNECGSYAYNITTDTIIANANFADTLIPGIKDLQLYLFSFCLVPGDTTLIIANAFNNGTVTVDTTFYIILDSHTTFVSSEPYAPIAIHGDTLVYHATLLSDSSTYVMIYASVSTTAMLGDTLTFTMVSPFQDNVIPTDDSAVYRREVASSFDPNYITVNQPLYFHRNNNMIYTVGFQNTGSYLAHNVVVIDTLDNKLDPATFHFLSASPDIPVIAWHEGNRIYFNFQHINLPDSLSNPSGSHGQFSYSIRAKTTVPDGDSIFNSAAIFFDYNLPVLTNHTTNILDAPAVVVKSNNVTNTAETYIYPNPTTGMITISLPGQNQTYLVTISDMYGSEVRKLETDKQSFTTQLNLNPGVYFVTIFNQVTHSNNVQKIIIE